MSTLVRPRIVLESPPGNATRVDTSDADPFPTVNLLEGPAPEGASLSVTDLLLDYDVNLVAGIGGSAKSTVMLYVAVCIVLGLPVFGSLVVSRPGPAVLVLAEDGLAAGRMMLDAIIEGLELNEGQREILERDLVMVAEDATVNLERDAARLGATAIAHDAVVLIADPIRPMIGGESENDNGVASRSVDALRREVCRRAGAAVVLCQNLRKPGKDALAGTTVGRFDIAGAGAWVDSVRMALMVSKRDSQVSIAVVKANRVRADIRHELELVIDADPENKAQWVKCTITDRNAGACSESLTPGKGRPINENERKALTCLDDRHEPGRRVSWSAWCDETGINRNTLKDIKDRLLDGGLASSIPTGKKNNFGSAVYCYAISPDGRKALASGWAFDRSSGVGVPSGE